MNIIESISSKGVKTTSGNSRFYIPRVGDIIDFGENVGTYPFTQKYGRFDNMDDGWAREDEYIVICEMGSVFLHDNGAVDISGGPFSTVKKADVEPMETLKDAMFWNWGDNGPGGGHGVYYTIARPLFRLKKQEDENNDTTNP